MSDENKPHDDHGPATGPEGTPETGPQADEAAAPAAPETVAVSAEPFADTHGDDGADAPAPATETTEAAAAPHEEAAPAPVAHERPVASAEEPVVVASQEAASQEPEAEAPAAEEPSPAHPTSEEAAAAAVGAVAAGAAIAAAAATPPEGKRPVWSDSGDAPFEDVETTPVYARDKKKDRKKPKDSGNEGFEIVKTIAFALLIALVLRVVLFQPFTIPSASMEPNLYEGDYIVVSKWSYGYSRHAIPFSPAIFQGRILSRQPARGDVVVFKLPRDNRTDYIKRVIGLPGDRVQMINNVLHINGAPVRDVVVTGQDVTNMYGMPIIQADETLPEGKTFRIQDFGPGNDLDDTPVFEVPARHYFMMGDNRDNSIDSRVDQSMGVGLVPEENLIGKAQIILFSWSPGASLWNPISWFSKIRPSRFFHTLD